VPLPRFAVVDVETSGFSARWNRILQLALVTVDADGTVVDQWSTMVASNWPLQRVGPTHVHGISRSTLKGAPHVDKTIREFARRVGTSTVTAHNAEFDGAFLRRAARRLSPNEPARRALEHPLCTLRMSRCLDPARERSHRLGDLCRHYGVELDRPHDALADALATAAVLPHLLRELDITNADQLRPFLR
jgi:DNA polymerase-3 subunit epsilon